MKIIAYDIEIKRGIPSKSHPTEPDIEYCAGWRDFSNMGISMITVFDFTTWMPRIFMSDNIVGFFEMYDRADVIVGYNNHNFDDNLLSTMGVRPKGEQISFDLLRAIWRAAGLDPTSFGYHHQGYGLEDVALANLGVGKLGNGALAAVLYQRQQFGEFTDYGLRDIMLTAYLLRLASKQPLLNPKKPGERLFVEIPFEVPAIPMLI